jgi:hypothetical protein
MTMTLRNPPRLDTEFIKRVQIFDPLGLDPDPEFTFDNPNKYSGYEFRFDGLIPGQAGAFVAQMGVSGNGFFTGAQDYQNHKPGSINTQPQAGITFGNEAVNPATGRLGVSGVARVSAANSSGFRSLQYQVSFDSTLSPAFRTWAGGGTFLGSTNYTLLKTLNPATQIDMIKFYFGGTWIKFGNITMRGILA